MNREALIERMRTEENAVRDTLNAWLVDIDPDNRSAEMTFDMPLAFCHSGDIVQGGFVAAMLDIAMYHAVMGSYENLKHMPTLELKVSYLAASRAGKFTAHATAIKAGRSIAFIEAKLTNADGEVTATATSTAKVITG